MTIKSLVDELVGLFVDDGSLAIAIVVVVAVGALVLPLVPVDAGERPVILLVLLLAVLIENIRRTVLRSIRWRQ
jgi:hypothetical protein